MGKLTRRDFIKTGATVAATGVTAVVVGRGVNKRTPEHTVAADSTPGEEWFTPTVCALCPAGCGLQVRVVDGRAVKVEGHPLHPLNQGVCCPRGQASLEVLYSPERLHGPMRQVERGSGQWEPISWEEAKATVAGKLRELRDTGQTHTVAFLHSRTRGQMRPLINRFMAACGSPNAISQRSVDEQTARLANYLTQGVNSTPVYDMENARYVMCFGGSLLESSQHLMRFLSAVGFMRRSQTTRSKLVIVDSRLSVSGAKADEWIPLRPGTYGALALGMAHVIIESGLYDEDFVRDFSFGFEDFEDEAGNTHKGFKTLVLEDYPLDRVSSITGVPAGDIARLAGEFAGSRPAIAMLPTGQGTSGNGLYAAMAVHALNALVGSIDAQGGVQTQRYLDLSEWPPLPADPVAEAGRAHSISDFFSAIPNPKSAMGESYPINLLFLLNANPVFHSPGAGQSAETLLEVPFVVSFSPLFDESTAHADLVLPASTFMEIWGDDYLEGTGYAGVSLRQPVVETLYDTRNPGDVLLQLAAEAGGPLAEALPWRNFEELVRFRLSALDVSWADLVANGSWSQLVYFYAEPGSPAWNQVVGRDRLAAPQDGRFDFFSRELYAALTHTADTVEDLSCLPHHSISDFSSAIPNPKSEIEYPFQLVTQELMPQAWGWEGVIPTLQEIYGLQVSVRWDSWVDIHPRAAEGLGIKDGDEVWVESVAGKIKTRARLCQGLWPGVVYMPLGQGHRTPVYWGRGTVEGEVIGANPNLLVTSASTPTRVRIYKA